MTLRIASVTFDCENVLALADFWSRALDRPVSAGPPAPSEYFAMIPPGDSGSPMMMFLRVPEGKSAKNRVHLDLASDDRAAEVGRLVELGATSLYDMAESGVSWTTLADPEGNEFCISDDLDESSAG